MLFSTTKLSCAHQLEEYSVHLNINGVELERTNSSLLFGIVMQHNLKWNDDINRKISSCYGTLSVLRKLAPYRIRKQLAECLILFKIDYNDVVSRSIPDYSMKQLQLEQLTAASFVLGHYASLSDVLSVGCLPILERREFHLSKLVYKAIHFSDWPSYLQLEKHKSSRILRSLSARRLVVPLLTGTFQDEAARVFNNLPENIGNCNKFIEYCRNSLAYFRLLAMDRLSSLM